MMKFTTPQRGVLKNYFIEELRFFLLTKVGIKETYFKQHYFLFEEKSENKVCSIEKNFS